MHCIKHTAPRNFFVPGSSRVTLPPIQRDKEHLCKAPIQSLTPATGDVWHMTYPEPGMTHMPFTWGLHDTSWYFIKPELQLLELTQWISKLQVSLLVLAEDQEMQVQLFTSQLCNGHVVRQFHATEEQSNPPSQIQRQQTQLLAWKKQMSKILKSQETDCLNVLHWFSAPKCEILPIFLCTPADPSSVRSLGTADNSWHSDRIKAFLSQRQLILTAGHTARTQWHLSFHVILWITEIHLDQNKYTIMHLWRESSA